MLIHVLIHNIISFLFFPVTKDDHQSPLYFAKSIQWIATIKKRHFRIKKLTSTHKENLLKCFYYIYIQYAFSYSLYKHWILKYAKYVCYSFLKVGNSLVQFFFCTFLYQRIYLLSLILKKIGENTKLYSLHFFHICNCALFIKVSFWGLCSSRVFPRYDFYMMNILRFGMNEKFVLLTFKCYLNII